VTLRVTALLALLLAGCTRNGVGVDELARFDTEHAQLKANADALRDRGAPDPEARDRQDFRNRKIGEDFAQWVFGAAAERGILKLRATAASAPREDAQRALAHARELLQREAFRGRQIANYWRRSSLAPFWRARWQAFHAANDIDAPEPGAAVLEAEQRLRAQLDVGNFLQANTESSPALVAAVREAIDAQAQRLGRDRSRREPKLEPRQTPCGAVVAPDPAKPDQHYLDGEPLEDFYPDDSVERGEEGPVVILLRISPQGCATARSITVHSGYAPLDAAALEWVETAGFAPRRSDGKPVESYLSFKVGFRIKN